MVECKTGSPGNLCKIRGKQSKVGPEREIDEESKRAREQREKEWKLGEPLESCAKERKEKARKEMKKGKRTEREVKR